VGLLQHADVVAQHRRYRRLLVVPQLTREREPQGRAVLVLIHQIQADPLLLQQGLHRLQTAARQGDVLGEVLCAADHPRLVPHRQAHRLGFVEGRVCKSSQADQAIEQWLRQVRALHVETIGQGEGDRGSQRSAELRHRRRCLPWGRQILVIDEAQIKGMGSAAGALDHARQRSPGSRCSEAR